MAPGLPSGPGCPCKGMKRSIRKEETLPSSGSGGRWGTGAHSQWTKRRAGMRAEWGGRGSHGPAGPPAHPSVKPVRPALKDKPSPLCRLPRTEKALRSPGWLSHAGRGRYLTWASTAQIPANPMAACIISPNIARNRPAIHGSDCSRVAHASARSAWTPALSGRWGWGRGGVGSGPPTGWEAEPPGTGVHWWNGAPGWGRPGAERGGAGGVQAGQG